MRHHFWIKKVYVFTFIIFTLSLSVCAFDASIDEALKNAAETMEKLDIKSITNLISSNISSYSKTLFLNFALCLTIIITGSFFSVMNSVFSKSETVFDLTVCCAVILIVFSPVTICFSKVLEHTKAICGFMLSVIPVCVTLHTASGNTLSASLLSSAGSSAIALLQTVTVSLIIPLAKSSLSIFTANIICKNKLLSSVSAALKNTSTWILGLSFTLFTGILSLQSILQAGADNLAMKGLKFGASKLIPIAGGMVSESMKTVIASVGYIKSVTGISGMVFIIYTLIPPLCFIALTKLYLTVLSACSKISYNHMISEFLDFVAGIMNIILAVLISCSVALIIILFIFIKSTVSL